MRSSVRIFIVGLVLHFAATIFPAEIKDYPIQLIPVKDVTITDDFWASRWEINRTVTIPHCIKMNEKTGRINGSTMYKVIEAAAYTLAKRDDPRLKEYVIQWIDKIVPEILPGQSGKTWKDLGWANNLYSAGHLFEAAVACYQGLGNKKLLDAALQIADYIDTIYGPGKRYDTPGHGEIEPGLAKLYRVTGDERYIKLAKFFLDQRGRILEFFGRRMRGEYYQDHEPVVQQSRAAGHAVSATYMYMGLTDVLGLLGTDDYLQVQDKIWEDIVTKKIHITGGIGARRLFEGFGDEYELPNFICWNETCAAIGNILWNHRLFLVEKDGKYIDVLERTLYNGFLVGVSLKGDLFFYQNPLVSFGDYERSEWFGVPCCPPNVARLMASLGGYIYARAENDVYVNLFIGSRAEIKTESNSVQIKQETRFPWEDKVKVTVDPEHSGDFTVFIRIPGWVQGQPLPGDLYRYLRKRNQQPGIKVNGELFSFRAERGYAAIQRTWKKGDTIELTLPMGVRRVIAHKNVEADTGRVALERGPVVYCVEQTDNNDNVFNLLVPDEAFIDSEYRDDFLNGVSTLTGRVLALQRGEDGVSVKKRDHDLVAVPYFAWANRGKGEMAVWLSREESKVKLPPAPTIASTSRITSSPSRPSGAPGIGNFPALVDQMEPQSSSDDSFSFFRLILTEGDTGWVQFDFIKPSEVSSVEVYWLDDHRFCKMPRSWRILYRDGETWRPVLNKDSYGVERDRFNTVTFDTVNTDGLRLEIKPQRKFYFDRQIGPPDGSFVTDGPIEWYECGIIELRIQ